MVRIFPIDLRDQQLDKQSMQVVWHQQPHQWSWWSWWKWISDINYINLLLVYHQKSSKNHPTSSITQSSSPLVSPEMCCSKMAIEPRKEGGFETLDSGMRYVWTMTMPDCSWNSTRCKSEKLHWYHFGHLKVLLILGCNQVDINNETELKMMIGCNQQNCKECINTIKHLSQHETILCPPRTKTVGAPDQVATFAHAPVAEAFLAGDTAQSN